MATSEAENEGTVDTRSLFDEAVLSCRTHSYDTQQDASVFPPNNLGTRRLVYFSHFLSTWNSRSFEFGAFLFLSIIYPQSLSPASVYALVRGASAATLSPWLGYIIDHSDRLRIVRLSIIGQRLAVALSCIAFYMLIWSDSLRSYRYASFLALAALSILACFEKLCAIANTISVERDWVVIIAEGDEETLRTINSQMRRIDLFCKLIAPLLVAFVATASTEIAIVVTGLMTATSILPEYFAIARVYKKLRARLKQAYTSICIYFSHRTFLPSFSLALLHLTVLSFSGQMITYLIAIGLQPGLIGLLRGVSVMCELGAIWIAPRIMQHVGPVRAGIWFINWQIFCLVVACTFFWLDVSPVPAAAGIVAAVIASRVGLWGFELSAQIIVQEEVEAELRGTFSSQEFAFQNAFGVLSFTSTIVFARPAQFRWPATISAAAVGAAAVLYAGFVRARRGHLVHLPNCVHRQAKRMSSKRGSERQRLVEDREEEQGPEASG